MTKLTRLPRYWTTIRSNERRILPKVLGSRILRHNVVPSQPRQALLELVHPLHDSDNAFGPFARRIELAVLLLSRRRWYRPVGRHAWIGD